MTAHPRAAALAAFALLVVVPAASAWASVRWHHRGRAAQWDATPTAWDHLAKNRGHCLVRVRLKSGDWVGGWFGAGSFLSAYPHPADIYLEQAWQLDGNGIFLKPLEHSDGLYIRTEEAAVVDFLIVPERTPEMSSRGFDPLERKGYRPVGQVQPPSEAPPVVGPVAQPDKNEPDKNEPDPEAG